MRKWFPGTTTTIGALTASLLAPLAHAAGAGVGTGQDLVHHFAAMTLAEGQAARVNIGHPNIVPANRRFPAGPCQVRVVAFNAVGDPLDRREVLVRRGETHSFEFGVDARGPLGQIRFRVVSVNPPEGDTLNPCRVTSAVEVFDVATGRTIVQSLPAAQEVVVNSPEGD